MSHKTQSSNVNFPEVERFWGKVQKASPSACWEWTGSRMTRGYGQFWYLGAPAGAHRVAYTLSHGPIPDGTEILHSCDNRLCCNPAHLSVGSHTDNMRDASQKGRMAVPRRRTREFKAEVIAKYLAGDGTALELGQRYGVCELTVLRWTKPYRKPWARPSAKKKAAA